MNTEPPVKVRVTRRFTAPEPGSMAMSPPVMRPASPPAPPVIRPITWALVSVVIRLQPSWVGT